jgi:hypothetical protein
MGKHLAALRERRRRLLAQADEERASLAASLARADAASAWLNTGLAMFAGARRHPVLVAGAAAVLLALRPRLTMRWLLRAWSLWRVVQSVRGAL